MQISDWSGKVVALLYGNAAKPLYIAINMTGGSVTFQLPSEHTWLRLVDTQSYFDTEPFFTDQGQSMLSSSNITLQSPELLTGVSYDLPARSILVLEAQP